jgi:hypothetical protein
MAQLHVIESSRDHEEAGRIIDQLRARGHAVSVDYDFLKPGMEWKRALGEAVAAADGLVAVLSANSVFAAERVGQQPLQGFRLVMPATLCCLHDTRLQPSYVTLDNRPIDAVPRCVGRCTCPCCCTHLLSSR